MKLLTPGFHFSVAWGIRSPIEVRAWLYDPDIVSPIGPVRVASIDAQLRPPIPNRLTAAWPPNTGVSNIGRAEADEVAAPLNADLDTASLNELIAPARCERRMIGEAQHRPGSQKLTPPSSAVETSF
jgi:hypothetical protein